MSRPKQLVEVLSARPTLEGAGVRLHRGFANAELPRFDPFLLFDDFSSPDPLDYLAGFPMHPHRGIETVTYVLDGEVRHRDSLGNSGSISGGDIQWMSAGSGIIHEEMPQGTRGLLGFQLWVNLPKKNKMMQPRYQDVGKKNIPIISVGNNAEVRIITGRVDGIVGPIEDIMAEPLYVDVTLASEGEFEFPIPEGHTTFIYIVSGALASGAEKSVVHEKRTILLFSHTGDAVSVRAGSSGARFLLVAGKPLHEPIAWHGPIVMNSDEELHTAFKELERGEFIKHRV